MVLETKWSVLFLLSICHILIARFNKVTKIDYVDKIKAIIEENSKFKEILIASIGPIMGTFTSEGAILVSVL